MKTQFPLEAIRATAKKAAAVNLRKFKIIAGNTGEMVVARLITDLNAGKDRTGRRRQRSDN